MSSILFDIANICKGSGDDIQYYYDSKWKSRRSQRKKALRCRVCNRKLWCKITALDNKCSCAHDGYSSCFPLYVAFTPNHEPHMIMVQQ